jgi:hypothetical protein
MAYQLAATDDNGMHGTVGCYSIYRALLENIYLETTEKNVLFPKLFYTLSKRRFLVLKGLCRMKIKSDQIFLNKVAVFICPGNMLLTIIFVFFLYISSHSSTQSHHVRFISWGRKSLVCDR